MLPPQQIFQQLTTHSTRQPGFLRSLPRLLLLSRNFSSLMSVNYSNMEAPGVTLDELPKSHVFTDKLPPDPNTPTPQIADSLPARPKPGLVKNAAFTWIKPEESAEFELLAVSPAAFDSIGLKRGQEKEDSFGRLVSGNKVWEGHYPWAQCYGGYQFGHWAGQLGDGRAISLFESTNPTTGIRYEWQLKGAGTTPYSRFADGKAVLRSSIREFIVSEALHGLGIPTTRALSLTLLPTKKAQRETTEPCAIVTRFAQSWLRVGTFDLPYSRNDRNLTRKLANYAIEEVYGGVDNLGGPREDGEPDGEPNRYELFYREVVRRNARTVAYWQAYGFMNGVLNTDNTSILGLSLDFGPFSFMDNFDPSFTPNHDDSSLRYSYRNQPTIIWWNMVRLGESLAELFGLGNLVDSPQYLSSGLQPSQLEPLTERAERIIDRAGEEYKNTFITTYQSLMSRRLGFSSQRDSDMENHFTTTLDLMEKLGLDFNHFFRRLADLPISHMESEDSRIMASEHFFNANSAVNMPGLAKDKANEKEKAKKEIAEWLGKWRERLGEEEGGLDDERRQREMKKVNPRFLPKNWVLDELINRVQRSGERDILHKILDMSLRPFEDHWGPESEWAEEDRLCGDVPPQDAGMQCSCSS
ncbi:hypothetical protein TWF481_004270 [Arthrobotrys musiformis]|uniref:Selenoprotein O n=1 Tax=Arthrobotrys musiformis TaxID=47236 RepID=A0AAV9WKZ8_9PEZI